MKPPPPPGKYLVLSPIGASTLDVGVRVLKPNITQFEDVRVVVVAVAAAIAVTFVTMHLTRDVRVRVIESVSGVIDCLAPFATYCCRRCASVGLCGLGLGCSCRAYLRITNILPLLVLALEGIGVVWCVMRGREFYDRYVMRECICQC